MIHQQFRKVDGTPVHDLAQYINREMEKDPSISIHIATDSQSIGREATNYATVIAFRYPSRGVHCLVCKQRLPHIRDRWQRLYKEAEMSVELANWINEHTDHKVAYIDLDYNDSARFFSSTVLSAGAGLVTGFGFPHTTKAQKQVAVRAADKYCS